MSSWLRRVDEIPCLWGFPVAIWTSAVVVVILFLNLKKLHCMKKDYYKVLGVAKDATPGEIKTAYRKLALQCHPDLHPHDKAATKKFQALNEANEVLSDPEKRKAYDQGGSDWKMVVETKNSAGPKRKKKPVRGKNYEMGLEIEITATSEARVCWVEVEGRQVWFKIPAGVETGDCLTFRGCGGPGKNGGADGDLDVKIWVTDDSRWTQERIDLYMIASIDLYTVLLGGEIIVDTLDGKVKIKINPGTQNGTIIKLKGKGFPGFSDSGRSGDFYVKLAVTLPTHLNMEEKKLFGRLSALRD